MEVQLDRSGFLPGEFIFFNIKIGNNSDKNIKSVKCKLEQVTLKGVQLSKRYFRLKHE